MDVITYLKGFVKKPLIKNSLVYAITDGICKAMSFILLPFVSYYLLPEELGIAANYEVLQSILSLLAGQAVVNGLAYFYYERTKESVSELVSSLFFLILFINIVFSIIILFSTGLIEGYLHIGLALQLLAVLSTTLFLLYSMNMILYRLEDNPYSFAKIQLATAAIHVGLLFLLVIHLKMGALGKIYSSIGGYVLLSGLHLYLLIKRGYLKFTIKLESVKQLLSFGLPLLPHSLSFWLKSGMDKILLTTFCGLAVNGLYSMAMSFGAIYSLFNNSFMMAYTPYLQKRINNINEENRISEEYAIVKQSYIIGLIFIALYFIVVGICWIFMKFILSDKYSDSFQFIPWIMMSLTIYSFYNIVIQFPYTTKKTLGLGIITFSGSLIQLGLTYILIRYFGQSGINISLVVGSLIIMLSVWWYSNKVYPLPWLKFFKIKR